jgi:hypothetical protein
MLTSLIGYGAAALVVGALFVGIIATVNRQYPVADEEDEERDTQA